jgi:hypothetical protein
LSREKAAREQAAHEPSGIRDSLLAIYAINDAMNQVILAGLDARAWRAKPPARRTGEGRTIAAIFAHLHNCRLMWLRHSAPHLKRPAPLDHEASRFGAHEERGLLPSHARGSAGRFTEAAHSEIFAWRMDAGMESHRDDVCLHVCARGSPSRTDHHACASAWLPSSRCFRFGRVVVGQAVEASRNSQAKVNNSWDCAAPSLVRRIRTNLVRYNFILWTA